MNNKTVEVVTVNGDLFQCIMTVVTKNTKGEYAIFLKDIAKLLGVDIKQLNQNISLDEGSYYQTQVPFKPMERVNRQDKYCYVQTGEKYEFSEYDIYWVMNDVEAMQYRFLENIRTGFFTFDVNFAVNFAMVCKDCLEQAYLFEKK
ncbi:MAG: hypothetical protein MJZ94_01170 [Bacteroidales bacterium]|nr:hypothetical protein [Bacteroidales bacterium]